MSFIKPENTWMLWAFLVGWAAISILLEQKYKWAGKVSGAIIALIGAIILANLNVIPKESPTYDAVWSYIVPIAIPMLLFKADLKKILKESGNMFAAFQISAIGTCVGAFLATLLFHNFIPQLYKVAGIMTGSYIGGGVNFAAMIAVFKPEENITNATIVADNLVMALFFFVLMTIPSIKFFQKKFKTLSGTELTNKEDNNAALYWERKEVSLKDIAKTVGIAVTVAAVSAQISIFFKGAIPNTGVLGIFNTLLGNQFLIITTLMVILATTFSKFFGEINGDQEIGTFLIYIFFVVLGVPASIMDIITKAPLLLLFCGIMAFTNLFITLFFGRLFKRFSLEELLLCSNASVGGPTTAVAMAIGKGWTKLIIPAMLSGLWGYIIGNYLGTFVGNILLKIFG